MLDSFVKKVKVICRDEVSVSSSNELLSKIVSGDIALNDILRFNGFIKKVRAVDVDSAIIRYDIDSAERTLRVYGQNMLISLHNAAFTAYERTYGYNYVTGKIDIGDRNISAGFYEIKNTLNDQLPVIAIGASNIPSPWIGCILATLGTSITASNTYTEKLSEMLGTNLVNLAVSGGSISTSSIYYPGKIYDRISELPLDVDLVIIEAGINDFRGNAVLGEITDNSLATFYGALNKIITDIQSGRPNAQIVMLTPYGNVDTWATGNWNTPNDSGNLLSQFQNAVSDVALSRSVHLIDVGRLAGIGTDKGDFYFYDGIHLNEQGGVKFSDYLYLKLREYSPLSNKVRTPIISPKGGYFENSQTVTIGCPTDGATIYFTENGDEPSGSSAIYSAPFEVSEPKTIKAKAIKAGMIDSNTASAEFSFDVVEIDTGVWSDFVPLNESDISGQNATFNVSVNEVDGAVVNGSYGAVFFNGSHNAIEWELQGGTDNMWVLFGSGTDGWVGIGDPGYAKRFVGKANFSNAGDLENYSTFVNNLPRIIGLSQNRKWRAARSGDLVIVQSFYDGNWITHFKNDITTMSLNADYYVNPKLGMLIEASYDGWKNIKVGTYTI